LNTICADSSFSTLSVNAWSKVSFFIERIECNWILWSHWTILSLSYFPTPGRSLLSKGRKVVGLILFVSNVFCWMLRFPQRVVNLSWIFVFKGSRNWQFCFFQRLETNVVFVRLVTYCKTLTLDWIIVRPNRLRATLWTTSIGMNYWRRVENTSLYQFLLSRYVFEPCLRSLIGSSMIPKSGGSPVNDPPIETAENPLCFTVSK
jgi:hypothetical protein